MSENPTAYAAMITISLPGANKQATASVVLTETDPVTTQGQTKLLRDCTLADLEAFANTWEAEVWQTYQTIRLIDLEETAELNVQVMLISAAGDMPLENWADRQVLLTPTAVPPVPETVPETPAPTQTATSAPGTTLATAVPQPPAPEPTKPEPTKPAPIPAAPLASDPEPTPTVQVSASISVYGEEEPHLQLPPRPSVRIAGQRLPLNRASWAAVDIFIEEPALRAAQAHALSSPSREVAGVLVGPRPEKQPDGRYNVFITDTIIAKHTVMQGASVTYTPESWRYMNDQLWQRYPDESAIMVGWYHTHPGFGIFLSGMDQFIHQNFFTQTWHIALVLDPIAKTSGFFCWDRQHTRVNKYDFPWPTWAQSW